MHVWLAPSAFFPHLGGVEELTLQLGLQLQERGHRVTVVTNRWPLDLASHEDVEGLACVRLPFLAPGRRPASRLRYVRQGPATARTMRAMERPDVVHVQCSSSQTAHLRPYCERYVVPLVLSTQGETAMDAQGIYARSHWMRRQLVRGSESAAALTACSAWTREHASSIAPRFAEAVVVPNGIDPDQWGGEQSHAPVFAVWGRHVSQKGIDLLLQAFPAVRAELPEARLLVGGDGPERSRLQAMAGDGVEFLGRLDRTGVRRLLERARVAVVPSRIEPFGIVALEALASGCGLVYSSRGGLAEAAGSCGRGVDPFDATALAEALLAEVRQPTPAASGRARAAQLGWREIAGRYEAVYEEARRRVRAPRLPAPLT